MDEMKYYRLEKGEVLVRRRGDLIEKKGADGQWHSAPELLWRFSCDDMSLIELKDAQIPPEERPE